MKGDEISDSDPQPLTTYSIMIHRGSGKIPLEQRTTLTEAVQRAVYVLARPDEDPAMLRQAMDGIFGPITAVEIWEYRDDVAQSLIWLFRSDAVREPKPWWRRCWEWIYNFNT